MLKPMTVQAGRQAGRLAGRRRQLIILVVVGKIKQTLDSDWNSDLGYYYCSWSELQSMTFLSPS